MAIDFISVSAQFEGKSWDMGNPMPHECESLHGVKTKNKKTLVLNWLWDSNFWWWP
jgi:hypothetical protein